MQFSFVLKNIYFTFATPSNNLLAIFSQNSALCLSTSHEHVFVLTCGPVIKKKKKIKNKNIIIRHL
jgi:hypothetical protein